MYISPDSLHTPATPPSTRTQDLLGAGKWNDSRIGRYRIAHVLYLWLRHMCHVLSRTTYKVAQNSLVVYLISTAKCKIHQNIRFKHNVLKTTRRIQSVHYFSAVKESVPHFLMPRLPVHRKLFQKLLKQITAFNFQSQMNSNIFVTFVRMLFSRNLAPGTNKQKQA